MKKVFLLLSVALCLVQCQKADLVIINAKIWTADNGQNRVQALAVKENRILSTGSNKKIKFLTGKGTRVIDAKGKLVLPGFNDAHLHFISGGQTLMQVDLMGCRDMREIQTRISKMCNSRPKGTWITGRGWDHTLFNDGQWPDKKHLDHISTVHPIFVRRVDGHAGWANSPALKIAGIKDHTPDPPGGQILRRPNSVEPTGVLLESAMGLVSQVVPQQNEKDQYAAALEAMDAAKRLGVTSIQDNSGLSTVKLYHRLLKENLLTVRVSEWMEFELADGPTVLLSNIKKYKKYCQSPYIRLGLLKGFVDGTLGSRTAYFFHPYDDDKRTCGLLQVDTRKLARIIHTADSLGIQIGLHCIGPKANWMALNAYAHALNQNGNRDHRHRIEHAQVLQKNDIARFSRLGVIASMQPTHCTSDLRWAEQRIGPDRCRGAYAWKSLLENGGRIAFGTDWPVEPLDPMRGIYSAVTRKNPDTQTPEGGWYPDQKLTSSEAIRLYTSDSAFAEFQEHEKGSLTPGQLADIIILSQDLFSVPEEKILQTRVDVTIFDGKVVYTRR